MTEPDGAARLPRPRPDELDPAQRRLYDAIVSGPRARTANPPVDEDGRLRGPFAAMLLSPVVGEALQGLGAALRFGSALSDRAREIATLLVARYCDSAYEWAAHSVLARGAGLTEDEIDALRSGRPEFDDDVEDLVARAAAAVLADGDLPDPLYAEAERVLGPGGIFDLVTLVGYYRLLAGVLATFRVPATG